MLTLERVGDRVRRLDGAQELTVQDIRRSYESPACRPPFFAKDVLPGTDSVLPDDFKLYAFQGQVGQVPIRRIAGLQSKEPPRVRYLRPDGSDLGQVTPGRRCDPTLPAPRDLPTMVRIAETMSRAVPLPFVRVDLYQLPDGVLLGELTRAPGGAQRYVAEHDRHLGALWEHAVARLEIDLIEQARSFACRFGPHSTELSSANAPPGTPDGACGRNPPGAFRAARPQGRSPDSAASRLNR